MSNKKQFQKWFTYFDFIPPCPGSKGQWQVKEDTDAQTPICAVPDPIGGERDSDGLNPRQRANARLIAAAPYFGQELPRMLIECQNISTGFGRPEHGAPSDCRVYILKLGHIIETHNCDDLQIN